MSSCRDSNAGHKSKGYDWVARYFDAIDDETSLDEVLDFIISLRDSLKSKGYTNIPSLTDLCMQVRENIIQMGASVDDELLEAIYERLIEKESSDIDCVQMTNAINRTNRADFIQVKSSKKKDKDGIKMSEGTAKGFMKAFAGALLCIIPHPLAWTIGGGLVLSGVTDMVKHAGDPIAEGSAEERLKNLPRPEKN